MTVLTFAELHFLLGDGGAQIRDRLQLASSKDAEGLAASGLASLAVRGLLMEAEGAIVPRPELRAIIGGLATASAWVEIGFAREASSSGVQIFDGGSARVQASPAPFGLFSLDVIDSSPSLPSVVSTLVDRFLDEDHAGAAFIKWAQPDAEEPRGIGIRRRESGALEIAVGASGNAEVTAMSLDEALRKIEEALAA